MDGWLYIRSWRVIGLISCSIGLASGMLAAWLIYRIGLIHQRWVWQRERARLQLIQREKLELAKRRRLRVSPSARFDSLEDLVQNRNAQTTADLRNSWEFLPPVQRQRIRRRARWIGLLVGVGATLLLLWWLSRWPGADVTLLLQLHQVIALLPLAQN